MEIFLTIYLILLVVYTLAGIYLIVSSILNENKDDWSLGWTILVLGLTIINILVTVILILFALSIPIIDFFKKRDITGTFTFILYIKNKFKNKHDV